MFSEFATVPRWEGDRDREFHRYIDADIFDSADKYWKERHATAEANLADAIEALEGLVGPHWKEAWCAALLTGEDGE